MTIEYKDSKRIFALSTDIADTATFEDDFSGADNWTDTGSGWGVNTTTDVIDFNADSPHNVTEGLYYDLGSALSSVFTIRFKLIIANFNIGSSSVENHLYFGVSDSTSHVRTQAQDFIGIHSTHWTGGNADWKTMTANNAALPATRSYTFTHALQAETLYVQIKSLSSSQFQVDLYSDSDYSELIESSGAQSHSATGLRYLKFQQRDNAPSGDNHTLNGTIDDVKVYDGTTTNKPTNVQNNSLLVEKDVARRYWFDEATPTTYETDFSSSTGWSQTGTQHSVNTSTGVIDWNGAASTSVHALSYDLGAVVEDNWTLRFKWVIENHTLGSNPGGWVSVGLSDSDDTVGGSGNQDSVSLGSYVGGGTNYIRFHHGNDGSMRQNFTNFSTTNEEATWYVQIVKTGTSVTIGLYPDSTYGTATESKTETISGTGFQYIVVKSRSDNTNGGSVYNGTIDDMKFYNGITSTTPATWTMQPTFEDDFSSSTGWTTVGSNITITGGVIQASAMVTQSDNRIYYDLGSALSDQFVIDFDHYANTASSGGFWQMFALTDTTSIPRTDDSIHALIDMGTWGTYLRYSNEGSETNLALAGSLTTGQWQYIRFVRDGTTGTLTVYSDSDRTNQVLSATGTIPTTVTGLRYFQSGALLGANSGTTTYKIDNLKVYDGVTSIN